MGDGRWKIPMFSGDGFLEWSKRMKKHLIEEGVWSWVEEGQRKAKRPEQIKLEMINDANALSIIRQSLSPDVFMTVVDAKTAKKAWDILHHNYTMMPKEKKIKAQGCSNEGASTDPMIEPSHDGSVRRSKMKKVLVDESTDDDSPNTLPDVGEEDDEIKPLSGDNPFFDIALPRSAVKPFCHLNFPSRLDSLLPSNDVQALVRFSGRDYRIKFYGSRRQKSFGSGWRQLVGDHNLEEGDFLVFEIMKCDADKLEINLQVLKNTLPPELEEEIKKRKLAAANKPKVIIDFPDPSTSDEEE